MKEKGKEKKTQKTKRRDEHLFFTKVDKMERGWDLEIAMRNGDLKYHPRKLDRYILLLMLLLWFIYGADSSGFAQQVSRRSPTPKRSTDQLQCGHSL